MVESHPLHWIIILNIVNAIGFIYNVPQMYHTWKTHSTKDINTEGQVLRAFCSIVWISYALIYIDIDLLISWVVTFISSAWILYFKARYEYFLIGEQPALHQFTNLEMV